MIQQIVLPSTHVESTHQLQSTSNLAFCTGDVHKCISRKVCDQLEGSDHKPVILSINETVSGTVFRFGQKTAPDTESQKELPSTFSSVCARSMNSGRVEIWYSCNLSIFWYSFIMKKNKYKPELHL